MLTIATAMQRKIKSMFPVFQNQIIIVLSQKITEDWSENGRKLLVSLQYLFK